MSGTSDHPEPESRSFRRRADLDARQRLVDDEAFDSQEPWSYDLGRPTHYREDGPPPRRREDPRSYDQGPPPRRHEDPRTYNQAAPPLRIGDAPWADESEQRQSRSYKRDEPRPSRQSPQHLNQKRPLDPLLIALIAACECAGAGSLVHSYEIAQTTQSNSAEFTWFWLGMFLLEFPLVALLVRRATSQTTRVAVLVLFGFVTFLPKLLRSPSGPEFHDEYAHWRATDEILSTHKLFQPNPIIHIIADYPGLHATTAALVNVTGLSIWQAALLLLVFFHVSLVLGVAFLAQSLGLDGRMAALAAVLYSFNSSFLYFDTQYAYESMAITLVVWTLVSFTRAIRSPPGRGRGAWAALTVLLSAGSVITHHLSTLALVAAMVTVSLALSFPSFARTTDWRRTAALAWAMTMAAALSAGAWFFYVAPSTFSYLSPFIGQGISELIQAATGTGGARQLFSGSLSPWWEQKSAYLVTLVAFCLAVGALLSLRRRVRQGLLPRGPLRAAVFAYAFLGLVYFPSTVFILSPSGAEGARRSWAFTWIGLSILVAPLVIALLDWSRRHQVQIAKRVILRSALCVAMAITLVGGTAAGLDASYRFPGPFLYGSDARSVTPELLGTSQWFSNRFGTGNSIVTDRYTGLVFGSFGLQNTASPSAGFPVWNLYLARPGAPIEPPTLPFDLILSGYKYLVVDERMASEIPELGVYFTINDPESVRPHGKESPFRETLKTFNMVSWLIKIYQSNNYSIYRMILPPVEGSGYSQHAPMSGKKVLQGQFLVGS